MYIEIANSRHPFPFYMIHHRKRNTENGNWAITHIINHSGIMPMQIQPERKNIYKKSLQKRFFTGRRPRELFARQLQHQHESHLRILCYLLVIGFNNVVLLFYFHCFILFMDLSIRAVSLHITSHYLFTNVFICKLLIYRFLASDGANCARQGLKLGVDEHVYFHACLVCNCICNF